MAFYQEEFVLSSKLIFICAGTPGKNLPTFFLKNHTVPKSNRG